MAKTLLKVANGEIDEKQLELEDGAADMIQPLKNLARKLGLGEGGNANDAAQKDMKSDKELKELRRDKSTEKSPTSRTSKKNAEKYKVKLIKPPLFKSEAELVLKKP